MSRPTIGQLAPPFELPIHGNGNDVDGDTTTWSLNEHAGGDHAVVLIFHRHIH